jgi:hypothetical protein
MRALAMLLLLAVGTTSAAKPSSFAAAAELAGYFLAHAVWNVSDGGTLTPILAWERHGERTMTRLAADDDGTALRAAEAWLDKNPEGAERAVVIYDRPDGAVRALVAVTVEFGPPRRSAQIVVRYRPADAEDGFAVGKPRVAARKALDAPIAKVFARFATGVDAHEKGARAWSAHLDAAL